MREQARLVSSDVIESVFGQYKQVGYSGCLQELGKMVLLLPLLVTEITAELVLQAMNSVKTSCVDEWAIKPLVHPPWRSEMLHFLSIYDDMESV